MTAIVDHKTKEWTLMLPLRRHRGLVMAIVVFALVFGGLNLAPATPFSYLDFSSTISNSATVAVAGIGETIVVIAGGLDLSAGTIISLTNCLIVAGIGNSSDPLISTLWTVAGILVGCLAGALNGFFIAYMRLQPIAVTLAMMFVVEGVTLLILHEPGGSVSAGYIALFTGDVIPLIVPTTLFLIVCILLAWAGLRRTPIGVALYAVGSDEGAALANGINSARVKIIAYTIAGGCYSLAGVLLTAQSGSADPLIGSPLLLPIFVAVVLGGTNLGGGRGGCVGTVFGSLTLVLIVNLLLVMNISSFVSTAAEGVLLIIAVLGNSFSKRSPLWRHLRLISGRWRRMSKVMAGPRQSKIIPPPPDVER